MTETGADFQSLPFEQKLGIAILPIDVERKKIVKVDGEDPGSPENPKMLKKFLYCTGITTIIFIAIYLLMKFEYLNLRNIII